MISRSARGDTHLHLPKIRQIIWYVYLCTNSLLFGSQPHVNCIAVQQPAECKLSLILLMGHAISWYAICILYSTTGGTISMQIGAKICSVAANGEPIVKFRTFCKRLAAALVQLACGWRPPRYKPPMFHRNAMKKKCCAAVASVFVLWSMNSHPGIAASWYENEKKDNKEDFAIITLARCHVTLTILQKKWRNWSHGSSSCSRQILASVCTRPAFSNTSFLAGVCIHRSWHP